jgi:hypothetical protein
VTVTVQHRAAGAADVVAMFLKAGRHAKFIGEEVLAEPMGVAAASPFLSGGVCLRPSGACSSNDGNGKTKNANHDRFLTKSGDFAPMPANIQPNGATLRLAINSVLPCRL